MALHLMPSFILTVLSVIVSNVRKYSHTFPLIRGLHSWLLVIVFLKIHIVFIYKWYFHRVLNSRSAFQRFQSIVCRSLLFFWSVFLWREYAFFSGFFYFLAACIIFLSVFVFGCFTMMFLFLFFLSFSFGLLLAIFLLHAWLFLH